KHILALTFTATLLARELNISHKLHFNGLDTFALAGFTASAGNIEGEMTGLVTHNLGLARIGKQIANAVESLGIGSGIGARGASNGGLIHHLHRINMMDTRELAMAAYRIFVGTQLLLNSCIQGIVDQGRLTRSADARYTNKLTERKVHIQHFKIVLACALQPNGLAASFTAFFGH